MAAGRRGSAFESHSVLLLGSGVLFLNNNCNNPSNNIQKNRTHFHNDEVNDEHFPFVIELGDVDPAEMVSPAAVVERRDAAVIRPDVQSGPSRVLKIVNIYFKCNK